MAQAYIGQDMRVFYTRTGSARYISHLDVNRCMQRALARSHLPIWYTQGFNPHIYITFAMPTPLGYESRCESMDFRLLEEVPEQELIERLNACLPAGFRVYHAAPPQYTPEDITTADYAIALSAPDQTAAELRVLFDRFYAQPQILADKKTKRGSKEIDLRPLMELCSLEERADGSLLVVLRLAAGAVLNINPSLVFDVFSAWSGVNLDCLRVEKRAVTVKKDEVEHNFA